MTSKLDENPKDFSFKDIAIELNVLAKEKELARKKLVITAKKLAVTAKEKEGARKKLVVIAQKLVLVAREKESVRKKLVVVAEELKSKATQLALIAREKESVRKKLVVVAEELKSKATQLALIAREKESVRKKLAETANELKLKDEQLVITSREMETFSYSVSHDLRAPLRAIDGFTQILVEDYADKLDDEGKRIAGIIRASTMQMGKLIDDLLSFSRLGRQAVKKSSVKMSNLVNEVYLELKKINIRPIEFVMDMLPDANADIDMIRQVWTNLLSNAIKFTNRLEKAKIEVGSTTNKDSTTYYVRDNGAGFDMKYVSKLFGVFQRLHSVEEFEGTGVGLANVKRIVERHGGSVSAEAKPGEGATFYFTLPKK